MPLEKATLVLALLLGSAAAVAAPFSPEQLGDKNGLAVRSGEGRINGYDLPVASLTGFSDANALFAKLVTSCAGRCTVTREATDVSQVFIVANVASDMCSTCLKMTPENLDAIMASAHTISVFDLSGSPTFAIATPTGKLLKHLLVQPALAYEGRILKRSLPRLTIKAQSRFAFADSRTESMSGVLSIPQDQALTLLEADLAVSGYRPFSQAGLPRQDGSALRPQNDANRNVWVKAQSVLRYQLTPLAGGTSTMVELNEVTSQ